MYILEQDSGAYYETGTVIAVGKNPFNLAEYAVKYGGYSRAGWRLQVAEDDGYVIKADDNSPLYWIKPILEVTSFGA
jgi:hypothetical protein